MLIKHGLYYDYFKKAYQETGIFKIELYKYSKLMDRMAFKGEWEFVVNYIADLMLASLGLRDLMKEEKAAQVFWNVYFGLILLYIVHSEKELNQGFSDLELEPLLVQHPGIKYSYLIEIKYIKPVGAKKQEPPQKQIDQLKTEAENQLIRYSLDEKFKKTIGQTALKRLVLIFCGNRMVHHGEVK